TNNHWQGQPLADFRAGESALVEFRLPAAFASGSYSLNPAASSHLRGDEYRILDWINNAALFRVRNPRRLAGYAEIPCKITVEKCGPRE
ncbi:MAG TPA: Wzt carbohydrate-binding domain-containing protein, partial [bacterium]|nr:Wzt carbohydrate-binding domain-containing protein [bacterium]